VPFKLSSRSLKALEGVHPDLVAVVKRAIQITPVDFVVIEGVRTIERQRELFKAGASRTMKSRHLVGMAVDLAPMLNGSVRWDWPLFYPLASSMKSAALELTYPVTWGGDWRKFKDGPHFELNKIRYPDPI